MPFCDLVKRINTHTWFCFLVGRFLFAAAGKTEANNTRITRIRFLFFQYFQRKLNFTLNITEAGRSL